MLRNSSPWIGLLLSSISFVPPAVAGVDLASPQRDERPLAIERHEQFRHSLPGARPKILFIGDSLTARWESTGKSDWLRDFVPLGAFDVGIEGETSSGLLWRMQDGEFGGISPKQVVLLIGTSSISSGTENIANGVIAVVHELRREFPASMIFCLGLLPRDIPNTPIRHKVTEINQMIAHQLADDPSVTPAQYVDLGYLLLAQDGSFRPGYMMSDQGHMMPAAYAALAPALLPYLIKGQER